MPSTRKRGGKYSRGYVTALCEKVNFYDVIGTFTKLCKVNDKYAYGVCPIHHEKTASFSFSEKDQFYLCFGCWSHGSSALKFVAHALWARDYKAKPLVFEENLTDGDPTDYNMQAIIYLAKMYRYWPSQYKKQIKKCGRPG